MNHREREILYTILNESSVTRIADLASRFDVSARTVRNDINNINYFLDEINGGCLEIGEKGIITNKVGKDASYILAQEGKVLYRTKLSKRERVALSAIILAVSSKYTTIAQLATMIRVSAATVVKDVKDVHEELRQRNIQLISRPSKGLIIAGREADIRQLVLDEQGVAFIMRFLEDLFPTFKTIKEKQSDLIGRIIEEREHVHGFYLTDYSYDYLILYIQIMLWRIAEGRQLEQLRLECNDFAKIADDIVECVSKHCNVTVTKNESVFLSNVLGNLRYMKRRERNREIVDIQIVALRFIEKVSQALGKDLEGDHDLFESLYHHLDSVLPAETKSFPPGLTLCEIAKEYPFVVRAVSDSQYILEAYAKRVLSPAEVVYITMHVCAALERKRNGDARIRVALVCHGGVGSSKLLAAKLRNRFSFQIVGVLSAHESQYINKDSVDLIISTIPLANPPVAYVQTSLLLTDMDCLAIKNKIERVQYADVGKRTAYNNGEIDFANKIKGDPGSEKVLRQIENRAQSSKELVYAPCLNQLLTEQFIRLNLSCADWQAAVKECGNILLQNGYISSRYIDAMINNVIANGAYIIISPEFAMPHADLGAGAYRTGMSLIRLQEPVSFDAERKAEAKFVCCLSAVDYSTHIRALINLVNILANDKFNMDLKHAETPKDAANVIREAERALEEQGLGYQIMESQFEHL
jgi:transcriptional antiterminator/mannitol/fructose-specific phosphotransferase system IIA component (Ntr-type)